MPVITYPNSFYDPTFTGNVGIANAETPVNLFARLFTDDDGALNIALTELPAEAPDAALAGGGAGNVNNGVHSYLVTFVTASGETQAGEASDPVTVVDKTLDGKVALTNIPIGSTYVTARKIYRTEAGGATYKLLTTIANNTATTYTDNTADGSLTTAPPIFNTAIDTRVLIGQDGIELPPINLSDLAPLAAFSQIANETATSATPTAVKMMGIPGQTSTATAAGTTTLTNVSKGQQIFTGATTQTVVLPVVTTLPVLGFGYWIINNSSGALTVNSSGANLVLTIAAGARALVFCKLLTGTSAASWDYVYVTTGITNSAPANALTKSDGTNLVASQITDDGTTANVANALTVDGSPVILDGSSVSIGTGDATATLNGSTPSAAFGAGGALFTIDGNTNTANITAPGGFLVNGSAVANSTSGVYTPTLTNGTNMAASTAFECQYMSVGSVITVSGKVIVDPTSVGNTILGLSLPIASNLGAEEDCAGTAFGPGIAGLGAAILGDAANNRAQMQWTAADFTSQSMFFSFTYQQIM